MANLELAISGKGICVLDGPMGTQLAAMGLEMGGQNCLSHPEAVLRVHRAYVAAGCEVLTTNTLTMNRISIEAHGVGVDVRAVNLAGCRLAREAADDLPVLGNISSTGQFLEPYGELAAEACEGCFREQAAILAEGGADGFMVETFVDLNEALCAVRACRSAAPGLPILSTLSFQSDQATLMGNRPADCAHALVEAGASAVGINCTSLPWDDLVAIIRAMRAAVRVPVVLRPNGGKPRVEARRSVFPMTAKEFADGMERCIAEGVALVGGCCGTSPEHIEALFRRLVRPRGHG